MGEIVYLWKDARIAAGITKPIIPEDNAERFLENLKSVLSREKQIDEEGE